MQRADAEVGGEEPARREQLGLHVTVFCFVCVAWQVSWAEMRKDSLMERTLGLGGRGPGPLMTS